MRPSHFPTPTGALMRASPLAATALAAALALSCSRPLPAPSPRMVDVGGHRLEVVQRGRGGPVVVVEAGLGQDWREWEGVLDSVAAHTTVIGYARAGYGGSDESPSPRTPRQLTAELHALHALLREVGAKPPYVLVGHSLGGLLVRVYASQHPDEVAGLLLVDPAHERQIREMTPLDSSLVSRFEERLKESRAERNDAPARESADIWPVLLRGTLPEAAAVPDVPTIVITSMRTDPSAGAIGLTREGKAVMHRLHAEMAARSTQGTHIATAESGHNVHLDQPALVVQSILKLVEKPR